MASKKAKSKVGSFEQAMAELESLVEAMESDQLPLEELVAHYEKGAGLLQHCEEVLAAARKRIELIEVGPVPEKELASSPEQGEDEKIHGAPEPSDAPDDDIRLL